MSPTGFASLAAQTGWAAFHHAAQALIDDPSQSLDAHLLQAFDDLRTLSATAENAARSSRGRIDPAPSGSRSSPDRTSRGRVRRFWTPRGRTEIDTP